MMRTKEMESKEQHTPSSERLNPHLTGSTRIEKKIGRRNLHSSDQLILEQGKIGRKEVL
jgi:hypothetical protein